MIGLILCLLTISCSSNRVSENNNTDHLYRIYVGGKYGFINEKGQIAIDPQFDKAYFYFSDGVCFAALDERKGLINYDGEFVVELNNVSWVYSFHDGQAIFYDNSWRYQGVLDTSGNIIVPSLYKEVTRDSLGYIVEDTLGNMGLLDKQGKTILPCRFDAVNPSSEGLFVVATSNHCGYVDAQGEWVIDSIYDDARGFGDGIARVKKDGKWFFIDHSGQVVERLSCYNNILTGFHDNHAFIEESGGIWLINTNGTKISKIDADSVFSFREGLASFKKDGKFGKIDTTGKVIVQPNYDRLYATEKGMSKFSENGKYGLIDKDGQIIVQPTHTANANFWDTIILFGQDSVEWLMTYYDRNGNVIWKDSPSGHFIWPEKPTKEDYEAYFDSKISELDPIEGIYYVTFNNIYQDRDDPNTIGTNGTEADFCAIIRVPNTNDFRAYFVEEPGYWWKKKFVQLGETNTYAIVDSDTNKSGIDDGKLILEDPNEFEIQLGTGHNTGYNFYWNHEFIKDYPNATQYELVKNAEWTGTGFAIADGYIATNYHVTCGAKSINIRGVNGDDDITYKGYVVASDKQNDLAIIRIVDKSFDGFEDIPYCIGKAIPEMGDNIYVLGYPLTTTMGNNVKLTDGVISSETGFKGSNAMYQISAPVQPGNSGGPLFDEEGNVIGVVCAKHADAENVNYAVKISYLFNLISQSNLDIKVSKKNNLPSGKMSKKIKKAKRFVYLIECSSH